MNAKENKKKFTGKFIDCIIYLTIAGSFAFCYLLGAIPLNKEKINGSMLLDLFDIVFISILILPPIIWLIVLIGKKQIWKVANANQSDAAKKDIGVETASSVINENHELLETAINAGQKNIVDDKRKRIEQELHANSVYIIDKAIEKFLNEEKLLIIISNYIKSHYVSPFILEYCALPLLKNGSNQQIKIQLTTAFYFALQFYNSDTQYFNFVKNFNQNILDYNVKNVRMAYDMRHSSYNLWKGPVVNEFKGYQNLFQMLQNQKIITIDTNENLHYYAFLYIFYLKSKQHFYNLAEERLKNLDIDINSDEQIIVEKLLKNDTPENIIVDTIWSINSKKNNYTDIMNLEYPSIEVRIKQIVKDLNEKDQIKRLLDTDNERIRYSMIDIDLMSGEQFEHFVAYLFNQLGYTAKTTQLSGDQGIDVIATKGKTKIAIQAKCYSQTVGNHAIMEAVAGAKYYSADKIMVVTNNYFTKSAKELAQSNNVILWDRTILKEKLEQI